MTKPEVRLIRREFKVRVQGSEMSVRTMAVLLELFPTGGVGATTGMVTVPQGLNPRLRKLKRVDPTARAARDAACVTRFATRASANNLFDD